MARSVTKSKTGRALDAKADKSPTPQAKRQRPGPAGNSPQAASLQIDQILHSFGDWRGETLAAVRRLIREADPDVVEECKWVKPSNALGVAVWSHGGIICTGEVYKQVVKLTFARGASLPDPQGLFNASLEGNARRAIDIREGDSIHAQALTALIRAAVAENLRQRASKTRASLETAAPASTKSRSPAVQKAKSADRKASQAKPQQIGKVVLLSGGNPQIAKADGDAPVQSYIAAMPGWKSNLGKKLDALIVREVPAVRKAVRWNSPFYGIEGQGWFLSFHVLTRYVKVTFFSGTSLRPIPPGGTEKSKEVRWIDIYEEGFDEAQMTSWVRQAAKLPGWIP
jgi:hypothetical protein